MTVLPLVLLFGLALQPAPPATPSDEPPAPTPTPVTSALPKPAPSVSPSSAAPEPVPEATPAATPTAAASPTPTAAAAPTPPAIVYGYRFVPRQPDHVPAGQPQIFAIYLNSKKLKSLGPIDIKVTTSPDVVKVFTRSNGREGAIPMLGSGDFEAMGKLPRLPIIASGISTNIEFVAVGANGKRVTIPVPVLLQ